LEDLHIEVRRILEKDLRKTWWESVDWICLTQNMGLWQALVNMVMYLWIPQKVENFFG